MRLARLRRDNVAEIRLVLERFALSLRSPRSSRTDGRILAYHSVGTPAWKVNDVSPRKFVRHIELALKAGYRFVPPHKIACGQGDSKDLAITFDDALKSVGMNAAPILAAYDIPWFVAVVTDWAEGNAWYHPELLMGWKEIEALVAGGAAIVSHSHTHPNFGKLEDGKAQEELVKSRELIGARLGLDVREFAIPFGASRNWTPRAHKLALSAGYETVYSYCETKRFPGTVGRSAITKWDGDRNFLAALNGAYDEWQEWV